MKKSRFILVALALTAAASFPAAAVAKNQAPCKTGSMFDGKIASMFDGKNGS
jgi:hypothetical protein